ncbi:hypothetical protein OIU84_023261 [Salix udensis]|uniref:Uncharacterized protein n=1 Tax=Salix udensis TaxID=889485 RepID=A0AAD6KQF3_9ROSI|nr:hypothetical protein OIU84_023261 [Salix udensis]
MSEMRFSDPSRLHLKKELTQIRKAARVLRDPGTSSSWKSPLNSARSAATMAAAAASASAWKHFESENAIQSGGGATGSHNSNSAHLDLHFKSGNNHGKDKRVFLYNWKSQKSSSEKSAFARNDADDDFESCSIQESLDDSLSDARNAGDSKSDTYMGETRSAAMIFRCRDANLVSPSMRRAMGIKKKGKKTNARLDVLSRYQQKEMNLRRLLKGHPSMGFGLGLGRDDVVEQSDDTEEYSNSDTPALSISSYDKYRKRNPSNVGSWDATTTSMNDGDDEEDDHLDLPGRQGCGIPCYWSKRTPRYRGVCGSSCCSPSLSDTLRRKGSSMLCGSQSLYHRRRRSLSISNKRRIGSRTGHVLLPLLTNSGDGIGGSSIGTGLSDDELSTNYGELDLEALSRLDGRRWSSCRSQDGLEIVALNGDGEEEGSPENIRSLSQKIQASPRGIGKTSAARIFASALNCTSAEEIKPCGYCRECSDFISGKTRDLLEVDGTDKKGIDKVRYLLKKISHRPPLGSSHYKVFLIDECHLLPSKMWLAFLKFLEEPPQRVVFIFVTTDPDNVPRTVQSRCQKYLFNKIKDGDIVARLRKISKEEKLDVELGALDLIALNADGSLRDAETMLDQLSLLGKKITTSLVNELVGVVSDEKLLELLELAMSSDTAETVKRARDLMDSGVDPMVLMSQMASLIMDLIAGTYNVVDAKHGDSLFGTQNLTEAELERLKHALRLLSEAEKQLRISSDRSTWFTATLLQLGSTTSMDLTQSSSSRRQSSRTTEEDPSSVSKESNAYKPKSDAQYLTQRSNSPPSLYREINGCSSHQGQYGFNAKPPRSQLVNSHTSLDDEITGNMIFRCKNSEKLDDIWEKCIEKCHSQTLRQLLHAHGKLLSISEVDGALAVYVAFEDQDIKARAERFLSSITNSIEIVLRRNVEVRIILVSDGLDSVIYVNQSELQEGHRQADTTLAIELGKKANCSGAVVGYSDSDFQEFPKLSKGSFNDVNAENSGERKQEMPMQRIESIIREQRLETAWLQAAEKGTPGSLSRLKPEKNQVLPQEDTYQQSQIDSIGSVVPSSQTWEDELNHELKVLKMQNRRVHHKDQIGNMVDHYPISPSLLHGSSYVINGSKESLGYESSSAGGGCSGLFCWNTNRSNREKAKGTPVHPRGRSGRFSLFGECAKQKKTDSRITR